ncbi:unnamed protein product, partial [Rotaria socialis]
MKCSIDTCGFTHDSIPLCITLQQSGAIIENDNKFVFIFKINGNNDIVCFPIVTLDDNQTYPPEYCSNCNYSIKNIELPVHKQVLIKRPIYLIYCADRSIRSKDLFKGGITLTDINNVQHSYTPTSCFMIRRYSDTLLLLKKNPTNYYSIRNLNKTAQGKMKIVSRADVDGATHLLIQDGDRFFSAGLLAVQVPDG